MAVGFLKKFIKMIFNNLAIKDITEIRSGWKIYIQQTWWTVESIHEVDEGFNTILSAPFKGRIKILIPKNTQWDVKW